LKKARAGTEIGVYRVHYEGGKEESLSIVYGVHISQWQDKPQAQDSAVIAWRGRDDLGQSVRLFKTSWPNPHPDLLVHSIDFVPKEPESEPFLVAITADGPSPIDLDPYFNSALARNWYGDILEAVPCVVFQSQGGREPARRMWVDSAPEPTFQITDGSGADIRALG